MQCSNKLPPYLGKGVMLMIFETLISLLGLLIATASLALDVITFVIADRKRKRPDKRSRSKG